jgi:hypothetical protein
MQLKKKSKICKNMHNKLLNFNSKHHNTNLYHIKFILYTSRTNMQMHKVPSPAYDTHFIIDY